MTDQPNASGVQDQPAPPEDPRSNRWIRRPRRSTGDRKIAGVAGGLGRAFGIDPVLIRVAFVVLTVFGGFGGLLYVLGWLLLPADGDEVSAVEALLGRGRSSVPPPLAVGLGVVAVIAAFSMFSWGLPFLPLAIGGAIVLAVMRKRGRLHHHDWRRPHQWHDDWAGPDTAQDWMTRTDEQVTRITEQARHWAEQARFAGDQARRAGRAARVDARSWRSGDWSTRTGGNSPFQQPAFWERPDASTGPGAIDLTKAAPSPGDMPEQAPRTTPPAWDPLGVAPFAWDLPEPTPLSPPVTGASRGGGVVARATMGVTLLVGGLLAAGVFAGWWALSWAQVSGIALGVLGLGLLFSALRGRGYSLIGPGVFLSLVTLALAATGVSGTTGYGAVDFHPGALSDVQSAYTANAGQILVDLSRITIPRGATKTVMVDLRGGHAIVMVPANMAVVATCEARVGRADCLGQSDDGISAFATNTRTSANSGTLTVDVRVNAGLAEVTDHE